VEAALRSFGVRLVKAEPVNASAEDAASTASAAYLIAMAMLREVSSNRLRATYKGSVTRTRTVTSTFFFYFYTPCHLSHTPDTAVDMGGTAHARTSNTRKTDKNALGCHGEGGRKTAGARVTPGGVGWETN